MRAKVGQFASHLLKVASEPNSTTSQAVVISNLQAGDARVFSSALETATDVDVYKVGGVSAGVTITVDVDAKTLSPASTLDSYARIFNSSGTQIGVNDDSGGTTDSLVSVTAGATGDYYVGISGYKNQNYNVVDGSGLSTATTTGPYSVKISLA